MIRRILSPVSVLAVLILVVIVLTRLNLYTLHADTVVAELGINPATSEKANHVDQAVLQSITRQAFGERLRQRLNRPARTVKIKAFRTDICEVRQLDFERFAKWHNTHRGLQQQDAIRSTSQGHRVAGQLNSPASGVDFESARAYCQALGGRLPWAEEWEAMASGLGGYIYPWGNHYSDQSWPYQEPDRNSAQRCGTHADAATPRGIQDLAGNVMEWSQGSRAVRMAQPAAHGAPAVRVRARALYALNAAWLEIDPRTRSHHLGFRCVYDGVVSVKLPWGGEGPQTLQVDGGFYTLGLPADVRIARLAVLLPQQQLREAHKLLAQSADAVRRRVNAGRCEVSRSDYRLFLSDPLVRLGLFANENEPGYTDYRPQDWDRQLENSGLPVTGISWWAADAFARWAGGRLPSVAEWQLLAAGPEGRAYPWGNVYADEATPAGEQPGLRSCQQAGRDTSPFGVRHLAGNVSEWTRSIAVDRGSYAMWVQGGNWLLPGQPTARTTFGRLVPLNHRSPDIGLRIIYD